MRADKVQTKSIKVLDWLGRTTLDIIGEAAFGVDFNSLNHPEVPIRIAYQRFFPFDAWGRLFYGLMTQTRLTNYLPMRAKREIIAARSTIVGIASQIIRDKQTKKLAKTLSREKDIIALIVRDNPTADGKADGKMSFETMRDQIMTFLGAGHDTTGTAIAWTLHLLAKYPATQDKLRREIQSHMPFLFSARRDDDSLLVTADKDRLPYLHNLCRESLRYIPVVPHTSRKNIADDILAGYRVPIGTTVYLNSNTINRARHFWGDTADEFDPDRWDKLPATYTPSAYMSFLQGPHGCIGKKFAETEIKTVLCCLLSMYRFDLDESVEDPENWKMWRVTLRPRDGITLKVTPLEWMAGGGEPGPR